MTNTTTAAKVTAALAILRKAGYVTRSNAKNTPKAMQALAQAAAGKPGYVAVTYTYPDGSVQVHVGPWGDGGQQAEQVLEAARQAFAGAGLTPVGTSAATGLRVR